MQRDAAAPRLRADRRRVLHSKHMATTDPAARAPRRRRYNLRHAHRRIAQKARDPHLAGAVPAKPAHAHTATAALNQPLKQKDPPFCKRRRSEEHTSELQSLMRISYAVFCLKKKTTTTRN